MKKAVWISSFLILIITAIVIQLLPDMVPSHYDIYGNADGTGSKYSFLAVPVILISAVGLLQYIGYKFTRDASDDESRQKAAANNKVLDIVSLFLALICGVTVFIGIYKAYIASKGGLQNLDIDSLKLTAILLGFMFIVLGNFLTKTKLNSGVGLRLECTMYNDNTWRKSNRFAAYALMLAGVLTVVSSAFTNGIVCILLLLLYLTAALIIMIVYAKKVYTEERQKNA